jgi:hypothetical protein
VANVYLRVSIHCQTEAYSVGFEDEAAIKNELEGMRRTHGRSNTGDCKIKWRGTRGATDAGSSAFDSGYHDTGIMFNVCYSFDLWI